MMDADFRTTQAGKERLNLVRAGSIVRVAAISVRDQQWGSQAYAYKKLHEQIPALTGDIRAMLDSVVPGLVHGVGL